MKILDVNTLMLSSRGNIWLPGEVWTLIRGLFGRCIPIVMLRHEVNDSCNRYIGELRYGPHSPNGVGTTLRADGFKWEVKLYPNKTFAANFGTRSGMEAHVRGRWLYLNEYREAKRALRAYRKNTRTERKEEDRIEKQLIKAKHKQDAQNFKSSIARRGDRNKVDARLTAEQL